MNIELKFILEHIIEAVSLLTGCHKDYCETDSPCRLCSESEICRELKIASEKLNSIQFAKPIPILKNRTASSEPEQAG